MAVGLPRIFQAVFGTALTVLPAQPSSISASSYMHAAPSSAACFHIRADTPLDKDTPAIFMGIRRWFRRRKMGDEIGRILREEPFLRTKGEDVLNRDEFDIEQIKQYVAGEIRFPRLEKLLELLCGDSKPEDIRAIENGSGHIPHVAIVMSSMGFRVLVKDPLVPAANIHNRLIRFGKAPKEWQERITYASDMTEIDKPSLAQIVIWSNPGLSMFRSEDNKIPQRLTSEMVAYMARDVAPDGYMILQTGSREYWAMMDPPGMKTVFNKAMTDENGMDGIVIPTVSYNKTNWLRVFKRES